MLASLKSYAHHILGALIVVAHASQIGTVVEHLSWWHIAAALMVFGIWFITRSRVQKEIELA